MQLEANDTIAFRILDNNTVWSYQIEPSGTGVRLTERRVAENVTAISKFLVDKILGGNDDFEQDVRRSIRQTLEHIKTVAERADTTAPARRSSRTHRPCSPESPACGPA